MKLTLRSRVGYTVFGDNRYFGYGTVSDLLGNETFTGLLATAVLGRRADDEMRAILDDISVIITAADPRVWPLKIARLVASYGGEISGYVGGQLCIEGHRIGPPITRYAAEMLLKLRERIADEEPDSALVSEVRGMVERGERFIGYGVPFREIDERMVALRAMVAERRRADLPFWKLQEMLTPIVLAERGIGPNVGIGLAALCLDLGLAPREIGTLLTVLNANCFVANAVEGAAQASEILRKLPDETIDYVGAPPRKSPKACRR